jgi:hypothetical protein
LEYQQFEKEFRGGIVYSFCLPYLPESEAAQLIEDIDQLLLPGRMLYLSIMEGNHSNSGIERAMEMYYLSGGLGLFVADDDVRDCDIVGTS